MRANFRPITLAVATLILAAACDDPPAGPDRLAGPSLDAGGAAACPTPADQVVNDEAELLSAIAAASPGEVIGLNGLIEVQADIAITTEALTLTCATPGSGLRAGAGAGVTDVLAAYADGVTIDRLVLDAGAAGGGALFALQAEDVHFTNNTVTCGPTYCAFFVATPLAHVENNYFESDGSLTGLHLQNRADTATVIGNTLVATSPSFSPVFGAIRVLRGSNVTIRQNRVSGPWQNSISGRFLSGARINDNRLADAVWDGILLIDVHNSVLRNNQATDAGEAGVWAGRACDNTFFGNNLNGNNNDWGAYFHPLTGSNTLVGNQNVVIDNGAYDCDGDAVIDPNIISGEGAVINGVNLGKTISDAASLDKQPS